MTVVEITVAIQEEIQEEIMISPESFLLSYLVIFFQMMTSSMWTIPATFLIDS